MKIDFTKKQFYVLAFVLLTSMSSFAQNLIYSDSFVVGRSYCPGSTNFDDWVSFRASLDTTQEIILSVNVRGTFDQTGRTCPDENISRQIANSLRFGIASTYSCGGYTWRVGGPGACYSGLCGTTANEVELSVDGSLCGCMSPGWSFRPAITNSNWGGINTATCGGANQRMTIEFEVLANDLIFSDLTIGTGGSLCSGKDYPISVKVTNNGPKPGIKADVLLQIPGRAPIRELLDLNKLAVGKDTVLVLNTQFSINQSGNNIPLKMYNLMPDLIASNDTAFATINVTPAPTGSSLTPVTPFDGRLDLGINNYPDMTNALKPVEYTFNAPTGYSNVSYGTDWSVSNISATKNGFIIPSSFVTITPPSGSQDGKITVIFPDNYEDSTVNLTLKATSTNGCDTVFMRQIYVAALVKVNFGFTQACAGEPTVFNNLSTVSKGAPRYIWYFGVNNDSLITFADPSYTYMNSGSYQVKLVGITDLGFVTDTTITVNVTEVPVAAFTVANECEGSALQFKNTSSISSGVLNYTWDFGDNNNSTDEEPNHLYSTPGKYSVKLLVNSSAGCKSEISKNVQQHPNPVAAFNAPVSTACVGYNFTFNNMTQLAYGEYGNTWSFGDGNTSKAKNPSYTYKTDGAYTVKLFVETEFGCIDSATTTIFATPSPEADFSAFQTCVNNPTNLVSIGNVLTSQSPSYSWTMSNGASANGENIQQVFTSRGRISVALKVQYANGCSDIISKWIDIDEKPIANFEAETVCSGNATNFINLSRFENGVLNTFWDFGDGNTATSLNPAHEYTQAQSYDVTLIASTGSSCNDTLSKTITVNETPICNFDYEIDWVNGYTPGNRSIKFTPANTNYSNYQWFFTKSENSTAVNPTHTFLYDGNYTVRLIASTNEGCSCESSKNITITTTGINLVEKGTIKVYPNPASDMFTLENLENDVKYEIINMDGKKLLEGNAVKGLNKINISKLNNGVYYVKVSSNDSIGVYSLQVIK